MEKSDQDLYYELTCYTLEHPDKIYFIHQHVVDVYTAQKADDYTKPIAIIFALAGLYLYIEKSYSGKQVQMAHVQISNNNKAWPAIRQPKQRGEITIIKVLQTPPGSERDIMINKWCISVWQAYKDCHETIAAYVNSLHISKDKFPDLR
jgi:hypothetical protein